jgi:hypothetical protein
MALDPQIQALAHGSTRGLRPARFDPWASARLSGAYRDQSSIGELHRFDREQRRHLSAPSSSRVDPER